MPTQSSTSTPKSRTTESYQYLSHVTPALLRPYLKQVMALATVPAATHTLLLNRSKAKAV